MKATPLWTVVLGWADRREAEAKRWVGGAGERRRGVGEPQGQKLELRVSPGSPLRGKVDASRIGAAGHSLGGKVSVIAASLDSRIRAVLGLDPVDSSVTCDPSRCPDASVMLPLPIPTAFLGELTDATGAFQACAPAADNYQTFYASAASPSIEVTVQGANHMSFLDDPTSCGLTCSVCNPATRPHAEVIALTRSYLAAFFLRHLTSDPRYDDYLTGNAAQTRYVQRGVAIIAAK